MVQLTSGCQCQLNADGLVDNQFVVDVTVVVDCLWRG